MLENPVIHKSIFILLFVSLLLSAGTVPTQANSPLQIVDLPSGVQLSWSIPAASTADAARRTLPVVRHRGYDLPMQTVTLFLPPGSTPTVVIEQLSATPLADRLPVGTVEVPPVLEGSPLPPLEEATLPSAPIFLLRSGVVQGRQIAVLAVSPFFQSAGTVQLATAFTAFVSDAHFGADLTAHASASTRNEAVDVPLNPAALRPGYKLTVTEPGMQEVLFSTLAAGYDTARLHLTHRRQPIPIEVLADRLRFYVPTVGDRWNQNSLYWLTFDQPGPQMGAGTAPEAVSLPGQTFERSSWRHNRVYVSTAPGLDSDHWFHARLAATAAMTHSFPTVVVPMTTTLPDVAGLSIYTATVVVAGNLPANECRLDRKAYKMRFEVLDASENVVETQLHEWNPSHEVANRCQLQENWELGWSTAVKPSALRFSLLPSALPGYDTSILFDSVQWERPVALELAGQGAHFWSSAGAGNYLWTALPASHYQLLLPLVAGPATESTRAQELLARPAAAPTGWQLYDVTAPDHPTIVPATAAGFTQAASPTPRHYLLVDLQDVARPQVIPHLPVDFGDPAAADALYIGPESFVSAIQPLLELRRSQGYTPDWVDLTDIYDVYSDGYVSAAAIRNFLRHRSDWQNTARTLSVTLVGDGSYDPFNYRNLYFPEETLHPVPPYMLKVDVYLDEAPCEACFAQLNGDDPLTGDDPDAINPKSNFFAPDIWLGRLPVRTTSELQGVVQKLLRYEQSMQLSGAQATQLLLADNHILRVGENNQVTLDPAGDFAAASSTVVAQLGYGADPQRLYYDLLPEREVVLTPIGTPSTVERLVPEPWRISSIPAIRQRTLDALQRGVGLLVYNGHGHHWQYANLEDRSGTNVAPLLSIVEASALTNGDNLFVGLSMTCLTSQFAIPAIAGTLDEIFVRNPNGGAVATWGSTGQNVASGHDYLQRGFVGLLRNSPPGSQRVGSLVEASRISLLTSPLTSSLDALKTFALLGDPLTRVRALVGFDQGLFLPNIQD
jgi:hypothetical protein